MLQRRTTLRLIFVSRVPSIPAWFGRLLEWSLTTDALRSPESRGPETQPRSPAEGGRALRRRTERPTVGGHSDEVTGSCCQTVAMLGIGACSRRPTVLVIGLGLKPLTVR